MVLFLSCQPKLVQAPVQLLVELCGILFVGERQASLALVELKGMEERAVAVVLESLVDFLVP